MGTKIDHIHTVQTSFFEATKHFFIHSYELGHHWFERRRTRQQLAEMPHYLLRDIGLTEADRQRELNKHFWQ